MSTIYPLVSVIVTCYNHERYIKECIESIVNQTYPNLELIVINDGSTDNSLSVIQELSKKYNFQYLNQDNAGLCPSLKRGAELTTGEYICACDSDDKFELTKIEKQVLFLQNNSKYECCYTNKVFFENNGLETVENPGKRTSGDLFEALILGTFSIPFSSHMVTRKVYDTIGIFDDNLKVCDWDYLLRVAKNFQIGFINENLLYYRIHSQNMHGQVNMNLNAKYAIINKWSDDPLYAKAIQELDIHYFNDFAKIDKIRAIKMIPHIIKYLDPRILKGFRRLLLKW